MSDLVGTGLKPEDQFSCITTHMIILEDNSFSKNTGKQQNANSDLLFLFFHDNLVLLRHCPFTL